MKKIFNVICYSFLIILISFQTKANVLGNMQTFAPNPDSLIFQNIHSSQTLDVNYFNVGFFGAYVRNELSTYSNLINPEFVEYKDKAATFDFIFTWGVSKNLEVTYSLPGYFSQEPDADQVRQNYISKGVNGHRLGFKYALDENRQGGFAIAGSSDISSTEDNPYIGNSPSPILNLEMVFDQKGKNDGYGFNIGYRKRTPGDAVANSYFLPISDQLIASAGYVAGLSKPWRLHAELFSSYALKKDNHPDQKYISSLEALFGAKYRIAKNWWTHGGLTFEVQPKGLAPEYRIYAGINHFFNFNGIDSEKTIARQKSSLNVEPQQIQMYTGERQAIKVRGGVEPYKFILSQDFGYYDDLNSEYVASDFPCTEQLMVRDAEGAIISVPIQVSAQLKGGETKQEPLQVLPAETSVYTGGVVQFKVLDGEGPYETSLEPARYGVFSGATLKYNAPTKAGVVSIFVKDRQGRKGRAVVKVLPIPSAGKSIVLRNLNFVFNTNQLTQASKLEMDKNLKNLMKVKIQSIIVVGHTDDIGEEEYNQELSQSRAEVVADLLIRKFELPSEQVKAVGYGESQPIASNKTVQGRLSNRRVELKIYYSK